MIATTLKLPADIKRRIRPLAELAGKSPHAWMVESLKRQVEREELREQLIEDALAAAERADAGAPLYAADEVHSYALALAAGRKTRRPRALPRRRAR